MNVVHRIRRAALTVGLLSALALAESAVLARAEAGQVVEIARRQEGGVSLVALGDLLRPLGGARRAAPDLGPVHVRIAGQEIVLLPGSTLVRGTTRSWTLPRPVAEREGRIWVPEAFVTEVLAALVPSPMSLRESHFFVGMDPGRLVSIEPNEIGARREIVFRGSFPFEPRLRTDGESVVIELDGCVSGEPIEWAGAGEIVTRVQETSIPGGSRVTLELSADYGVVDWRGRSSDELRLLVELRRGPRAARPARAKTQVSRIVIDPGHGGDDHGARLPHERLEKWITLELARVLADSLGAAGFEVLLTRNEDRTLSPEERAEFANESRGDLFLSVQLYTYPTQDTPPVSCVVHDVSGKAGSARVVAGYRMVAWEDVQSVHLDESLAAGQWLMRELDGAEPLRTPLRSLMGLDMPSVSVQVPAALRVSGIWSQWVRQFAHGVTEAALQWSNRNRPPPWHRSRGFR